MRPFSQSPETGSASNNNKEIWVGKGHVTCSPSPAVSKAPAPPASTAVPSSSTSRPATRCKPVIPFPCRFVSGKFDQVADREEIAQAVFLITRQQIRLRPQLVKCYYPWCVPAREKETAAQAGNFGSLPETAMEKAFGSPISRSASRARRARTCGGSGGATAAIPRPSSSKGSHKAYAPAIRHRANDGPDDPRP